MNQTYLNSTRTAVLLLKPSKAIRLLLMVLFVFITPLVSFGQASQTFSTPGTYAFTFPAGVTSVKVEAWGSGGGGSITGTAGGGGAFAGNNNLVVTPGVTYDIKVGSGAARGSGLDGGDSNFGSLVIAKGGKGGANLGTGGLASESIGAIRKNGGSGGAGSGSGGGGGGGAGGTTNNGSNGSGGNGGAGGAGGLFGGGAGGAGGKNNENGADGISPGGGGGERGGSGFSSGGGGNGQIQITWICPSYSLTSTFASSVCVNNSSSVTFSSPAANLPVGIYKVTYDLSAPNAATGLTSSMTVSAAGTGAFTTPILTNSGSTTVKITKLESGSSSLATPLCSNVISVNNTATATVNAASEAGTVSANQTICMGSSPSNITLAGNAGTIQWQFSVNNSTWTAIAGATAGTLTSTQMGTLSAIRYFRAVVTSGSCAVATSATVTVTVSPTSVGGTISGGTTSICRGSTIGTLTLSGQVGTIVQWERKLDSGAWSNIGNGGSTAFSEIPYAAGTWQYRALVQRASCDSAYSSIQIIVVSPTPVGGNVDYATTPICINTATTLNLSGITGAVVRWEKRVNSGSWTNIANTTTTLSDTPSSSGNWEYRALVNSGSCAAVYSASRSVDVNPILTVALTSDNVSVCQGTNNPLISYISTTGNPKGYVLDFDATANAAGIQDQNGNLNTAPNSIKINYMPSNIPLGVYNGNLTVITYSPSCSSVVYAISITVTAPPVVPILETPTQPNCKTPAGTVTVTAPSPAAGITYTITGTNPVVAAEMNTTGVFSSLAAGNYNVTTTNGSCTSAPVAVVIIAFVELENKWIGTAWSKPGGPTSEQRLVFADDYSADVDVEGCSCQVISGGWVDVNEGITLKLTNGIDVSGTGRILFKDKSSLVQKNNVLNTGNIYYERKISNSIRPTDYTYWSSPVAGFALGNVYPDNATGLFYSYRVQSGVEDWQQESSSTEMDAGKGYIINGAQPRSGVNPPSSTQPFIGVPNNGTITFPIGFTGATTEGTSNLLGNPYPSAIDADKFLAANATILDGTLYFWTHNTALDLAGNIINPGLGWAFTYSLNDYASYNLTGGVGIQNAKGGVSAPSDPLYPLPAGIIDLGKKPSGKIAAGQGFFTTSIKAGNVTFTNEMRVAGTSGNNSQFFKTKNLKGKTADTIDKNRLWLNLSNTQGAFKQTLIGYVTGATNDYDNLFDGQSFDANEFVDFYSVYQDKNLVIQGRALPFEETDEVQLGFRTTIDGTFTINIDQVDGVLTNQAVFIEDKLANTIFDLKSGDYTFSTAPGTFNDRFVLRYNNKTLGTENFDSLTSKVIISNANKQIKINSFAETIDKVVIYDLLGRQIYQKVSVNNNELSIANLISSHQTLVVKTLLQNGNTFTDKIIY